MRRHPAWSLWTAAISVLVLLAAPAALADQPSASDAEEWPRCVHPWPCGDGSEWPKNVTGPFTVPPVIEVDVPSFDGVTLHGRLWVPAVPPGVKRPVLLVSSPYDGLFPPGTTEANLITRGYAVAAFSVRGTGRSGGCFENKGLTEQRDQAELVKWLGKQSWSNGRVAMMGLSYPGTTPLMAAIQSPEPLKLIIPMGPVTDPFTEMHSPQGALYTMAPPNEAGRRGAVTGAPVDHATNPTGGSGSLAQRACPEVARVIANPTTGMINDDRDPAYWKARNLTMGFPNITAAVLIGHGLKERAHPYQEDPMWASISGAPKQMLLGQWAHENPRGDWGAMKTAHLDFWLKGLGDPPPGLNTVTYQDGGQVWRTSTAWPPAEAAEEVLYLSGGALGTAPKAESTTFRSLSTPRTSNVPGRANTGAEGWSECRTETGARVAYDSGVLTEPLNIAGNPKAWLKLSSDAPGGIVQVGVYVIPAGADCGSARLLSVGSADLRFHTDTYTGRDFPVNKPTGVRIDLTNLAEPVAAGQRLVVLVGAPDLISYHEVNNPLADERTSRAGQPYAPNLTVLGAAGDVTSSHVVLPLIEGSLGGAAPTVAYPPRPNVPAVAGSH